MVVVLAVRRNSNPNYIKKIIKTIKNPAYSLRFINNVCPQHYVKVSTFYRCNIYVTSVLGGFLQSPVTFHSAVLLVVCSWYGVPKTLIRASSLTELNKKLSLKNCYLKNIFTEVGKRRLYLSGISEITIKN